MALWYSAEVNWDNRKTRDPKQKGHWELEN